MTQARALSLPGCLTFLLLGLTGASAAVAQPTRFAYAISADRLHVLPVDPLTGSTGIGTEVTLAAPGASHIAIDPTARYVWVSHRVTKGGVRGLVTTYRLRDDTADPIQTLTFNHPVEMVAWEPTGRFAYVASRSGTTGQTTVFAIAQQTGLADPIQKVTTDPPKRIEVDPSGRYLIALTATGTAAVYDITVETGIITLRSWPFEFAPLPVGSGAATPLAVVAHPAGRFLSIAFNNRVQTYFLPDGVFGNGGSSVFLDKPERVIVHPTGRYVFVASPSSSSIHVLRVTQVTNAWTELASTITGVPATDIALDPAGDYLYAVGGEKVATLKIDVSQGQLGLVQMQAVPSPVVGLRLATPSERFLFSTAGDTTITARSHATTGALDVAADHGLSLHHASVDPSNRYLATVNAGGGLDTLRIDPASGRLDLAATLKLEYPVSATAFDPTGRYLLTTCTAGPSCGWLPGSNMVRWVTSYAVDSSTGALTPIGSFATEHDAALDAARSRIVFDPNGRWAYVARAQNAGSRVDVIGLNADGTLYHIQNVALPNRHVFDIAVDSTSLSDFPSQSLYVLSQATNGAGQPVTTNLVVLNRYPVNLWPDGSLTIPFDSTNLVQSISCRGCSWGRVVPHPTGRFLHVVTGGGTSVGFAQTLRSETLPLTQTGQIVNFNFSPFVLTGTAAADPSGRFLYLGAKGGVIVRVSVDQATGWFSEMTGEGIGGSQPVSALLSTGRIR